MSATVFSLPIPLILLVHLHILEYPHANEPEYDHHIFDSRVRGLRERIKSLEDTFYFLVGRLHGNGRTILPSYPCLQPSDTIAFRTSLAKYLESLRHQSLYPAPKEPNGLGVKSNQKQKTIKRKDFAWWWKDVVVRKSLLEECSGEKFERLLLSVSTHVLFQGVSSSTAPLPENASHLLRNQPVIYSDLLSKYNSIRHIWSRSASVLLQRQDDLKSIRERLNYDDGVLTSKYLSLETERLVALADSKFQDLLRNFWQSCEGRRALEFLTQLCGFKPLDTVISPHPSTIRSTLHTVESKYTTAPPLPLPIAAAYHPANLKKIRRPVFLSAKSKARSVAQHALSEVAASRIDSSFAKIALSDRLNTELRTQQALADALAKVKKVGQEMISSVKTFEMKREGMAPVAPGLLLDLWQPDQRDHQSVKFDTQPTPELLSALGLYTPGTEQTLDVRIDYIRESVLSAYPSVPDLSASRLAFVGKQAFNSENLHPGPSRIPRAKPESTKALSLGDASIKNVQSPSQQTPEPSPPRPLITSTPPLTIRQRSANIRQPAVTQTAETHGLRRGSRVPQKSIRSSLATNRRPSLFSSDEEENEVHRIVRGTHEGSFEDPHAPMTPRVKGTPVHRIFTGTKSSTVKRQKQSYPMTFHEPPIALPSLVSSSSSFNDLLANVTDNGNVNHVNHDGWKNRRNNGSSWLQEARAEVDMVDDDANDYSDEGPSMTLRDILLQADTTQFDLLDAEEHENLGDESFGWD